MPDRSTIEDITGVHEVDSLDPLRHLLQAASAATDTAARKALVADFLDSGESIHLTAWAYVEQRRAVEALLARLSGVRGLGGLSHTIGNALKDEARAIREEHRSVGRTSRRAPIADAHHPKFGGGGSAPPPGDPASHAPNEPGDAPPSTRTQRPTIVITGRQQSEVVDLARDAMLARNDPPYLFRQGNVLCRIRAEADTPSIQELTSPAAAEELARAADWFTVKNDELVASPQPASIAGWVVSTVDLRLPPIRRMVTTPCYDARWNLLVEPGYHPDAALYFAPPPDLVGSWPSKPTDADVAAALQLLRYDWLGDFPFGKDTDYAHHLATLLVPLVREGIDGPTPFTLYSGPSRGVGKTLLPQQLGSLYTGQAGSVTALPKVEEEIEKRISALLIRGSMSVLFDNVDAGLDSPALAQLATSVRWEGRVLGRSEMVTLDNRTLWMISAKNPPASDELTRRLIEVGLVPQSERPWERAPTEFKQPQLTRWTLQNRKPLLAALITLVERWRDLGRPRGEGRKGSYESWVEVVGGILKAVAVTGFLEKTEGGAEERETADPLKELLASWGALLLLPHAPALPAAFRKNGMTARELLEFARNLDPQNWMPPDDWTAYTLGTRLGRLANVVVGAWRLVKAKPGNDKLTRWNLQPVKHDPREDRADREPPPSGPVPGQAPDDPGWSPDVGSTSGNVRHNVRNENDAFQGVNSNLPDVEDLSPTPYRKPFFPSIFGDREIHTQNGSIAGGVEGVENVQRPDDQEKSIYKVNNTPPDVAPDVDLQRPERPALDEASPRFQYAPAPGALNVVAAIEHEARALGWQHDDLYRTSDGLVLPSGAYGLICYLDRGSTITSVTPTRIGIRHRDGCEQGFYNPQRPSTKGDR